MSIFTHLGISFSVFKSLPSKLSTKTFPSNENIDNKLTDVRYMAFCDKYLFDSEIKIS